LGASAILGRHPHERPKNRRDRQSRCSMPSTRGCAGSSGRPIACSSPPSGRPRTSSEREIATPPFRPGASRRLYRTSGDDPSRVPYETTEGGISVLSWREVRRGVSVPAGPEGTRSSKPRNLGYFRLDWHVSRLYRSLKSPAEASRALNSRYVSNVRLTPVLVGHLFCCSAPTHTNPQIREDPWN
jgi:hypothetical protein